MRKTLKRVLSTALAGLMVASVATVAVSANEGQKTLVTFQQAWEKHFEPLLGEIETAEYYFYMPDTWKNQYNDYYDGSDPNSYVAGVYWWEGPAIPKEYPDNTNEWPGYAVTDRDPDCANVYKAVVPADVPTIVWNNSVNGGMDNTLDIFTAALQSADAPVTGYDPGMDNYGFYPNGLSSMKGMIYVCNHDDILENPVSHKETYRGEWFYYYGNGEYGYAPTKEEAGDNVYSNGEFPPTKLTASKIQIDAGVGGDITFTTNKGGATAVSEDEAIATVTKNEETGVFTVTGVAVGETKVTATFFNEKTQETETVVLPVTVIEPYLDPSSLTMNVGDEEYVLGFGIGENAVFSSSNKKVAKFDGNSVVAVGPGKATVSATQGGVTVECDVTVKAPKLNKTKLNLDAGKSYKLKVTGATGKAKFSTTNNKVATVDSKGNVTALKRGSATIKVKVDGQTLTCKVTVKTNPKLAKSTAIVKRKGKVTVKITGAASTPKVSKCKVAKISASKTKLTIKGGAKKGSQKVTVTVNGVKLKLTVKVK